MKFQLEIITGDIKEVNNVFQVTKVFSAFQT